MILAEAAIGVLLGALQFGLLAADDLQNVASSSSLQEHQSISGLHLGSLESLDDGEKNLPPGVEQATLETVALLEGTISCVAFFQHFKVVILALAALVTDIFVHLTDCLLMGGKTIDCYCCCCCCPVDVYLATERLSD